MTLVACEISDDCLAALCRGVNSPPSSGGPRPFQVEVTTGDAQLAGRSGRPDTHRGCVRGPVRRSHHPDRLCACQDAVDKAQVRCTCRRWPFVFQDRRVAREPTEITQSVT